MIAEVSLDIRDGNVEVLAGNELANPESSSPVLASISNERVTEPGGAHVHVQPADASASEYSEDFDSPSSPSNHSFQFSFFVTVQFHIKSIFVCKSSVKIERFQFRSLIILTCVICQVQVPSGLRR